MDDDAPPLTLRASIERLNRLVLELFLRDGQSLALKDISTLATTLKNLAAAARADAETEDKITARALRKAALAAGDAALERGISASTVAQIRQRILGLTGHRSEE